MDQHRSSVAPLHANPGDPAGQNFGGVFDPEIAGLFDEGFAELDPAQRALIGDRIDKLIWQEVHHLPLYPSAGAYAEKDTLANWGAKGERVLNAEFPPTTQARSVLSAIGAGETTFTNLARRTGLNQGSLNRTLASLTRDLRVVAARRPLSSAPSRLTQYAVDDQYLRFWLRFVAPHMELVLRGRGDLAAHEVSERWPEYRGRAVEPLVRRSIERLLPDDRFGAATHVGSFWTRTGDVEVDLVGFPSPDSPTTVAFVGSVKWRDRAAFDRADLHRLAAHRSHVPGAGDAPLVAVARNRVSADADVALVAGDLVDAWR